MLLTRGNGGYLNPAVTLALGSLDAYIDPSRVGKHFLRALVFLVSQLVGAAFGM